MTEIDHRKIGQQQKLFIFHEYSPGSCFFLPHGTRIYSRLLEYMRAQYRKRGFQEVITPNIYRCDLWKISGHWQKYKENMFVFRDDASDCTISEIAAETSIDDSHTTTDETPEEAGAKEHAHRMLQQQNDAHTYALKPMNCPGHCLMYASENRSYRDLPIRMADFGVLHRNELSGALTGLTRVRKFSQDDAHIFCRPDQIRQEIMECLAFVKDVYGKFGFTFTVCLSTKPAQYVGDDAIWESAENTLRAALAEFTGVGVADIKVDAGGGAFYGPKIDIQLTDTYGRQHQCATIQLDFNLPSPDRFNLEYVDDKDQRHHPVIIHRAIYGSLERFIALLTEHYAGKWPFWLSPRQCIIIPISEKTIAYATSVYERIYDAGYHVDIDRSDNTLDKRIRNALTEQYNYVVVIGEKEEKAGTVNIRYRDDPKNRRVCTVAELLNELSTL